MKKHLSFLSVVIFSLCFVFISCNKDDDEQSREELLTQGSWKFRSATNNGTTYTGFATCQTDNVLKFNLPGTGVVDEGATKCNIGDPQTIPFTWSLVNNKTDIVVSLPFFTDAATTLTIITLTNSQLVVDAAISRPGPSIQVRITFEH